MEKQPLVSVIVPVYKAEKYLHRCVESLLAQTFTDFEILLIDDGSPDRSGEICDGYAAKDGRVRVFHKENGGVSSARNLGLDNISGIYVTFIDADDWVDVDYFEKSVSKLKDGVDILQTSYRIVNEDSVVISVKLFESEPMNWDYVIGKDCYIVTVWGNFFRHSVILNNHLRFNERLCLGEDILFFISVVIHSCEIAQTKESFYNYFQHSLSATHNTKKEELIKLSNELLLVVDKFIIFKPLIDRLISNFYLSLICREDSYDKTLDEIYIKAKVNLRNLNNYSSKLLYLCSKFGMGFSRRVLALYFKYKNLYSKYKTRIVYT